MMKLRNLTHWLLVTTLLTASAAACGDDDDDNSNTGGSSSAGRGGSGQSGNTSLGGTDNSTADGGTDSLPNAGRAGSATGINGGAGGAGGELGGLAGMGGAGAAAGADAGGAGGAAAAALTDAQILLVLDTLNQGEVDEAYAALPRLSAADVKAFAQMMVTDHSAARQMVVATADDLQQNPAPSQVQLDLKEEAEAHVAQLRATSAANLDQTYINMEVAGHADALMLLSELEAAADAAELRTLIGNLETTVQDHYDSAIAIQADF
jgi:putative membrane protein